MKILMLATICAAMVFASSAASAVTLSLAGGGYDNYTLGAGFNLDERAGYAALAVGVGTGTQVKVLYASNQTMGNGLTVDAPSYVTYTYLGKEAGFSNSLKFSTGNTTLFNTGSSVLGAVSGPYSILAGLIPFMLTSSGDNKLANVFNDGLASAGMNLAYYLLSATSALVFLDDFGAGPDRDFDDIGIRIDVAALSAAAPALVPLPAGLPLLAAGLGLLSLVGWRKKRVMAANA